MEEELRALLNRHSEDNKANTPDTILAKYLMCCLEAYKAAVADRDGWKARIISRALKK